VVVVFQRSELISAGPHPAEDEDDAAISAVSMGAIPMKRQGSDSGRSMAIPMRSRQSSNTSVSDFNTFRSRNSGSSLTSPKWDAEAIL
jgi:protein-serine/threonine kinase